MTVARGAVSHRSPIRSTGHAESGRHLGDSVTILAPAKVNLTLSVCGRRPDGYHDIHSHAVGIDICDRMRFRARRDGIIHVRCSDLSIQTDTNLSTLAANAVRDSALAGPATNGVDIDLDKVIPVGAGLGGGSSDAAATLLACNELWKLGRTAGDLKPIAAVVGSDVPLFFDLPAARMRGRGEIVEPFELAWSGFAVVVLAGPGVSTAEVYQSWRPDDSRAHHHHDDAADALRVGERATDIEGTLFNDLEPAVRRVAPYVGEAQDRLARDGHGMFRISGAGSALFRLFDDESMGNDLARTVRQQGFTTFVAAAPLRARRQQHEES